MSSVWYPFYPGDYGRDTAHLSLVEQGAYRTLLDHYYSTRGPLPRDNAALFRICRASDDVERAAVVSVVRQFFLLHDDGHHNVRADRELIKQAELRDRLSGSGRRGAQKRWGMNGQDKSHPNGEASSQAISLPMANPQPHPHPDKETTTAPENGATVELPDWIPPGTWNAFLDMRRKMRKPLVPAAVKLAIKKLEDLRAAGNDPKLVLEQSILNSWQGLFELRVPFETRGAGEVRRRSDVGVYDPSKQRAATPEEIAELDRRLAEHEREERLWKGLENGTLEVTDGTVAWANQKLEPLKKVRLAPLDLRPAQLSGFLRKAREARAEGF